MGGIRSALRVHGAEAGVPAVYTCRLDRVLLVSSAQLRRLSEDKLNLVNIAFRLFGRAAQNVRRHCMRSLPNVYAC